MWIEIQERERSRIWGST